MGDTNIPGYFVWNPARRLPTYVHRDYDDASAQANKLARENPGERFHVMATLGFYEFPKPGPVWTEIEADSHRLPF